MPCMAGWWQWPHMRAMWRRESIVRMRWWTQEEEEPGALVVMSPRPTTPPAGHQLTTTAHIYIETLDRISSQSQSSGPTSDTSIQHPSLPTNQLLILANTSLRTQQYIKDGADPTDSGPHRPLLVNIASLLSKRQPSDLHQEPISLKFKLNH